mmetsp:Transcript_32564/g.79952  ORF Transcript_32564/g.79952 Transcript_32564/m.79952 type:complete len:132 (+) Transcript_32564:396-791(+)
MLLLCVGGKKGCFSCALEWVCQEAQHPPHRVEADMGPYETAGVRLDMRFVHFNGARFEVAAARGALPALQAALHARSTCQHTLSVGLIIVKLIIFVSVVKLKQLQQLVWQQPEQLVKLLIYIFVVEPEQQQ